MSDNLSLPAPTRIPLGTATIAGQRQEVFLSPEWARYFNSLNTSVVTVVSEAPIPGPPGPAGPPGASGSGSGSGSATYVMLPADDGDAPEFVPGIQGAQGLQGVQGSAGPALGLLYLTDEPSELPFTPQSTLQQVSVPGAILSSGIAGIGYTVGAGGTVTQVTSKATGVTLNTPTGQITMNAASLGATTTVSFTLTNSVISAADTLDIHRKSGGTALAYNVWVDSIAAGSAVIAVRNITAGALLEAVVLQFTVQKGSNT